MMSHMPRHWTGSPVISTQARQAPHSGSAAHACASVQQFSLAHSKHASPIGSGVQSNMPPPEELEPEPLVEELEAVVEACDDDACELELATEVDFDEPDALDETWLEVVPPPPVPVSSPQPVATSAEQAKADAVKPNKKALFIAIPPEFRSVSYRAGLRKLQLSVYRQPNIAHKS